MYILLPRLRKVNQALILIFDFYILHFSCPRQESNLDPELRRLLFYPLNYRDKTFRLIVTNFYRKGKI